MTYLKTSLFMLGNILTGGSVKVSHSEEYREIRRDILDLKIPTQHNDKKNLQKDRNEVVKDLRKAFDLKVHG